MEKHVLKVLEFDKIVDRLAEQAASTLGRERALALIPMTNVEAIRKMQDETSEAVGVLRFHGSIPLGGISDIRPIVRKAELQSMLQPLELLDIAHTLASGRRLRSFLVKQKEQYPLLGQMADNMTTFEHIEKTIERCIGAGGEVVDSASPALSRIRSDLKTKHSRILDKLNSMIQSSQYRTAIQEPVITQREDRYCIPVKVEYRAQVRGIVHDASASGATVFVEPEQTVELGNDMKRLAVQEREEVERILKDLSSQVGTAAPDILTTMEALAHVDFVAAKAKLSIAQDAAAPLLNHNGWLRLVQARHPLLSGDVVPIDVELGRKFRALLITGPNTGGKTVTLKTIGLLTIMAQSGLHVPASAGTEIAVFKQLFADIGDEQSIEQSLSTFSSHIRNIVHVLKTLQPNALVLFDEIGAGTDPGEGAALAKAILEFILDRGARVVATTHYGELKEFAFVREGVQNASVEFDIQTLRPTYRLMVGVPGSSNAFAIASRLGMPDDVITRAESSIVGREDGTDEVIRRIEESHRAAQEDRRLAKNAADDAESLRKRYEEQLRKLESARARVEEEVRLRGKQIAEKYTRRFEHALAQLSEVPKQGREAEAIKQDIRQAIKEVRREVVQAPEPEEEEPPAEEAAFHKGDQVKVVSLNQEGILTEAISDGQATVVIGAMKVTVPVSSLRPGTGKKISEKRPEPTGISVTLTKAMNVSPEIMLRAQRVEEALYDLDRYIDEAQAAGLQQVRVIHGKGTGAMRKAVWQYLTNHPSVDSYRLGEQAEGGSGATVVKLKV
jgi:DNA mismatch repair protein MutS2